MPNYDLIILTPNGGEVFYKNTERVIRWEHSDLSGSVQIDLFEDGWYQGYVINTTLNNGYYLWSISNDIFASKKYKIRIKHIQNTTKFDFSNEDFEIKN
mgnify:CR=1 FL=1